MGLFMINLLSLIGYITVVVGYAAMLTTCDSWGYSEQPTILIRIPEWVYGFNIHPRCPKLFLDDC